MECILESYIESEGKDSTEFWKERAENLEEEILHIGFPFHRCQEMCVIENV